MKTKWILKKIFTILIILIILIIIFLIGFIFKWKTFNQWINSIKLWFIEYQAKNKNGLMPCTDLNDTDIKILNNSFKNTKINWNIDYWCNLTKLEIRNNKNTIVLPKEIWKLNNLQIIRLWKNNLIW